MCVYESGLLLLFAYIALLLLPLSFVLGVGAPSLSLVTFGFIFFFVIEAVRRGSLSFSWFVVASAACVCEKGLLLVCACRTSAASVEPLPRGSRAVAFPLWLQVLSCSTWLILIVCSLLHQLFLLCFGFVGANSNSMNSISRAACCVLRSLRRCLCCRSCATSIMIWK